MDYDQGLWFIICAVITGFGVIGAFFAFARRGVASGFRVLGWALLPLAAALTGLVELLFNFGTATVRFVTNFVLSIEAWVGLAMFAFAFVLLGGAAFARRRRAGSEPEQVEGGRAARAGKDQQQAAGQGKQQVDSGKKQGEKPDDPLSGFEDIEEILKNRGIS